MERTEIIYELAPKELDLHPLAETTPVMTDNNYTALKADIEVNGQLEPVTLYRGRIIDGRHRWLILQELGITTITAIKLPHNTSATKLKSIVHSKETRRHKTPTQLAITAYRLMLESTTKLTQKDAAAVVGADARKVSDAKHIANTHGRMDILDTLFDGDKLNIGSEYEPFRTDSLPAILDWLKASTTVKKAKDNRRGTVEMTEDQFKDCALRVVELKGLDMKQIKHIASKLYQHVKEHEVLEAEKREELK